MLLHNDCAKLKKLGTNFFWGHGPSATPVERPHGAHPLPNHSYSSTFFARSVIRAMCDPMVARLVVICVGCERRSM